MNRTGSELNKDDLVDQDDASETIRVRGARTHNLRNIDVDLPRLRLIALTGVSGSGKSSLAFDTLFAEGQRRFLESMAIYARGFLDPLETADVDQIEGLPPTVAVDQHASVAGPRSTVGTTSEILDALRLLYAKVGQPHCPSCGISIDRQSPDQIISKVLQFSEGTKVMVLAPLIRGRKGIHREAFEAIRKRGLIRARVDGTIVELDPEQDPKPARTKLHTIEAVVDRLVIREGVRPRLTESLELSIQMGEGLVILCVHQEDQWVDQVLSTKLACPGCGQGFSELEPRSLSFNSPHGACPSCDGLGVHETFSAELVLPDLTLSLDQGAIAPLSQKTENRKSPKSLHHQVPGLKDWLSQRGLSSTKPLKSWSEQQRSQLLEGDPDSDFAGVNSYLQAQADRGKTQAQRQVWDTFRESRPCSECQGTRLNGLARSVTLQDRSLPEILSMSLDQGHAWLSTLRFAPPHDQVGLAIVSEAVRRIHFLLEVGLAYLSLDRRMETLSSGEAQRVRLATQIGAGLTGVAYVLDEPTAGLHPRDSGRLIASLKQLQDLGNTILVVEHDEAMIRAADWIVDLGPGPGPEGGTIVAQGSIDQICHEPQSRTGQALRKADEASGANLPSTSPRLESSPGFICLRGASGHSLRDVDVSIPRGTLTAITGVSGSGKSTLIMETLTPALRRQISQAGPLPLPYRELSGIESIEQVIPIDQRPIGRNSRSTPATYTGVFDEIRKAFAQTRDARIRGWTASRFSFNSGPGRCPECQGLGQRKVEMQYLADYFVPCHVCHGQRYEPATLEIRYRDHSLGEVLDLTVEAASDLFDAVPKAKRPLDALKQAGLGYLRLGQASQTLSGGEAQRVKLATELARPTSGKAFYVLDEPTGGLHAHDVERLIGVLRNLADRGNTVVVIEHHLDLVRVCDWVVDLGPEGGSAGGQIVFQGPLAQLVESPTSLTAAALAGRLSTR